MRGVGRYLVIVLLATLPTALCAEGISVRGVVKGADGKVLSGATVIEYGTINTAESDAEGVFTISTEQGKILLVTCFGYKMGQAAAAPTMEVLLESDKQSVNVGYGNSDKDQVTGAITQLNDSDIGMSDMSSLAEAIQGMVAGVTVAGGSPIPGESPSIIVRGDASFIGEDTQPLYVIDGLPMDGDPGINPRSIKSVEFLKDAASCAVYGTRGAAGVILITTK